MRKRIKHIIPICFLMLMGCGQVYANTFSIVNTPAPFSQNTVYQDNCDVDMFFYTHISLPDKDVFRKIADFNDSEEECSETIAHKKNTDKAVCYSSFFNQGSIVVPALADTATLSSNKVLSPYLPSYSSSLYLLFEVFRI